MFVLKLLLYFNLIFYIKSASLNVESSNINEIKDPLKNIIDNREYILNENSNNKQHKQQHAPHIVKKNQETHHNNRTAHHYQQQQQRKPPKNNNDDLIINTGSGAIRGRAFYTDHHIPRNSKNKNYPFGRKKYRVNAWLGIPFAEKPLGNLRFKRPVPIKNWEGVLNATELPNSCYQIHDTVISDFEGVEIWNANTKIDEDCLYLNIWTPHPMPKNSPVMVRVNRIAIESDLSFILIKTESYFFLLIFSHALRSTQY